MIKTSNKTLISIKNLRISFLKKNETFRVVKNISFDLLKNEVLGIVGESGSGKSVTALSILKLLPKNKTISKGEVIYNNANLLELSEASIRQVRQKDISIIFQEPMSALNPTMKCVDQLRECFDIEKIDKKRLFIKTWGNDYRHDQWWFPEPIISCYGMEEFGYKTSACRGAENVGKKIVNFPVPCSHRDLEKYKLGFERFINRIKNV